MDRFVEEKKLAKELGVLPAHVCIVGSTLICGAGNDVDFLCLLPSEDAAVKAGFLPDLEISYESPLRSFRRGNQNAIVTTDPRFFFAEVAIAHAAKAVAGRQFNMADRTERVNFHGEIRDFVLWRLSEVEEVNF